MKKSNLFITLVAGLMALTATAVPVGTTPVHRPLIEEYTGTWCGWCVRGYVGMELLRESLGDSYVGIAYHNGDAMETINSTSYPNTVNYFPCAYAERTNELDALFGFGNVSGGVLSDMQQLAALEVIAGVDVSAMWTSDAKTSISVDVSSFFTTDISEGKYAIEIILLADDLYGTGSGWNQANYYSGYTQYQKDTYLGPWVRKPGTVSGLHFNDVILGTSGVISGSLPSTIVAYDDYTYNYTFTLSQLPKPALVQNKDNLRIAVILVNTSNKHAINANQCHISDFVAVILGDVNDDHEVGIADVTDLIDYLLGNDSLSINLLNADVDGDEAVGISDVTALIDLLLGGGN